MKSLTGPLAAEAAAAQSGWCEVVDLYLKAAIATPFGTTDKLRLCTRPGGLSFFTPKLWPEAAGTQGASQDYSFWPLRRERIQGDANFTTDKMSLAGSNVTGEWAAMLGAVDWYDVPIIIRKVATTISSPTADDCAILFSGFVDSVRVTQETVQLICSNDMSSFTVQKPAEAMHSNCRFRYTDDFCTIPRYKTSEYRAGTVNIGGSTTTLIASNDLGEDGGTSGTYGTDLINGISNAAISVSSQISGFEGYRVRDVYGGTWLWDIVDWGTQSQGTYSNPAWATGIYNPELRPWIQFDFGTSKNPRLWRITNAGGSLEEMPKLFGLFASDDGVGWNFGRWIEIPPVQSLPVDVNLHWGYSARYWRLCQRTRWAENKSGTLLGKVQAYEPSRNYWAHGRIRFDSSTATAALRGVWRTVLQSYNHQVIVAPLPAVPQSGDTFTIQRGCARNFNACAEKINTENFGGFNSLPAETVPR